MKFRNYCIVLLGKTNGVKMEIAKIADGDPRFLDAKGLTISTFISVAEPKELSDYFKSLNRNFMLFDMDTNFSGYNLENEKLHETLFSDIIENNSNNNLEDMSNRLIDDINESIIINPISGSSKHFNEKLRRVVEDINFEPKAVKLDLNNLSKTDRETMINKILDKGYENFSENDKKILKKIGMSF